MMPGEIQSSGMAEGLSAVARDGDQLVVPRGTDLSSDCFFCGKPASAKVKCRLRQKNGLDMMQGGETSGDMITAIIMLLGLLVYVFVFVFDWSAARQRTLTYGLCTRHQKKRTWMLTSAPICLLAGIGALVFLLVHSNESFSVALTVGIVGAILAIVSASLYLAAPAPQLSGFNEQFLWVKGADETILARYPQMPKAPAAEPKKKKK